MRKLTETKIVLASHNKGKLREIAALLDPYGIEVVSAGDLGFDEPDETEDNFIGNARIKAHFAAKSSGLPALSDDSGLAIDALDGAPGVYSADWAETDTGRDFQMAMGKVHDQLADKPLPHTARFCCTLCLAWPDGHDEIFEGTVEGTITSPMRGERGFGYDPIFVGKGMDETFAQIDPDEKNRIGHRADAFEKLVAGVFG